MVDLLLALIQDPYSLNIQSEGTIEAPAGYHDGFTGEALTIEQVADRAQESRFVLIGEHHDSLEAHKMQAEVIATLAERGVTVVVGMEMFSRDFQTRLMELPAGVLPDEEFIERSGWAEAWGMDFSLYKPIFDVVQEHDMPIAALNIPRTWVRTISREGSDKLSPRQRLWVPHNEITHAGHRELFESLMGGHPVTGTSGEQILAAQVAWDVGMAKSAVDFMRDFDDDAVMVIIAGNGHVMYDVGINLRLRELGEDSLLTISYLPVSAPQRISAGVGDVVFRPDTTEN